MSYENNGGPAFPMANDSDKKYNWIEKGMTLRDYFAAQALMGIYASPNFHTETMFDAATEAYEMADAMLQARKK